MWRDKTSWLWTEKCANWIKVDITSSRCDSQMWGCGVCECALRGNNLRPHTHTVCTGMIVATIDGELGGALCLKRAISKRFWLLLQLRIHYEQRHCMTPPKQIKNMHVERVKWQKKAFGHHHLIWDISSKHIWNCVRAAGHADFRERSWAYRLVQRVKWRVAMAQCWNMIKQWTLGYCSFGQCPKFGNSPKCRIGLMIGCEVMIVMIGWDENLSTNLGHLQLKTPPSEANRS